MKTFEFTLTRKETPLTIDGADYVLVELDGKSRDRYLGELSKRLATGADNAPKGVRNFDGLQAGLIAVTLFKIEGDEREPVSMKTIQEWPASVISALFKEAQSLSALDEKADEGND